MRHRLELQSLSSEQDEYGQEVGEYWPIATVWGSLEPLSAREILSAQTQEGEVTHRAVIRCNANLTVRDRIAYKNRTFEITSVINPLERNARMALLLKEVL
jgi:SPP1 family predicted phage head-tail adaptor